jgi:F-type H+-transporting ATPase subunit epsilon
MASFLLELVSPEKLLLSRQVEMATIPALEGEMGVLPGHAPMIVALKGGVIKVQEDGRETEKLFVGGGFAEVTPGRVTVLADEATPLAQLSRSAAEAKLAEATAALAALAPTETEERRDAALLRVLSAQAAVAAAEAA